MVNKEVINGIEVYSSGPTKTMKTGLYYCGKRDGIFCAYCDKEKTVGPWKCCKN